MHETFMISAFEGWNDASQAASEVIHYLIGHYESKLIHEINSDGYYDYQATRPMLCHITGRARIIWPHTSFYDITLSPDLHVLVQIAPEPNYHWKDYCREVLHVAEDYDVTHVITLGSMYAACPHTRPLPVDISSATCSCELDREYSGPIGITTILDQMACNAGMRTTSMWVSIPKYMNTDMCAQGTLELVHGLSTILGVPLDTKDLAARAETWKMKASTIAACDDRLSAYIAKLEREYDLAQRARTIASLGAPQAEQLVKEAEAFLKRIE